MNAIIKVNCQFHESRFLLNDGGGIIKCVYDTNGNGDLIPVEFTQNGSVITLENQPHGVLYYRYKKTKAHGKEVDSITYTPVGSREKYTLIKSS